MDELFWEEASRVVSNGRDGPVDARRRLVQEELHAALKGQDSAVRGRVLNRLQESGERIVYEFQKITQRVVETKYRLEEEFYRAKRLRRPPPDIVPHPDHVKLSQGSIKFYGPTTHEGRDAWELIKARIRVTACLHQIAKNEFRRTGCAMAQRDLKTMEKDRRALMRLVPKGWNWREEIYCRDSMLEFAKDTVKRLEEIGYVAPEVGH